MAKLRTESLEQYIRYSLDSLTQQSREVRLMDELHVLHLVGTLHTQNCTHCDLYEELAETEGLLFNNAFDEYREAKKGNYGQEI